MGTKKSKTPKNEFVVLLHGIIRDIEMLPLAWYLRSHGYDSQHILYPSNHKNLEDLVDYVDAKIKKSPKYSEDKPMHFVGNSMGGLIARYYIAARKPKNLGRVVMLGTPNTGSEHADFVLNNKHLAPITRKILGPVLDQLSTTYKHGDDITYPLGIIAGNVSINPIAPWVLPGGEHDGVVPVERTKIAGMTDHIVMPSNHFSIMFNPDVMRQVAHFLEKEHFLREHLQNPPQPLK